MGLAPGYLVSKHVKLVRMLKRGGMGSVWIADHLALRTQVAVKFISGAGAEDPAMVTRFNREATSAAQIKSPHVVQIHDHGITADGLPFMVMELMEGEDLATRIKRETKLPVGDVATIVLQTCRVLTRAHKLGIIHRDIKPSNIFLVDTDGDIFIKLLDFGIAKTGSEPSEITGTGVAVGTMCYMSPEQLLSARRVDHRADLWSLGVVAYRALTGQLPFKDDDGLGALCRSLEQGIFFPPSAYVPDLPPDIDLFFDRIFQRDPMQRFDSAKEMSEAFFTAIGDAPPSTSRGSVLSLLGPGDGDRQEATKLDGPSSKAVAAVTASLPAEQTLAAKGNARIEKPSEVGADAASIVPNGERDTTSDARPGTLSGTASTPPPEPKPRSGARRVLVGAAMLAVLAGGAVAGMRFLPGYLRVNAGSPIAGDSPAPVPPPPPAAPTENPVVVVPSTPSESPTVSVAPPATASAKAATSSSTAPTSSAAPVKSAATAAATGSGKAKPRPNKPEKDYGF